MASAVKVLLVVTHPVQYAVPIYRLYAEDPRLELTVAYCSLQGAETGLDSEFGVEFSWDTPLLGNYRWTNPPNRFGLMNLSLWGLARKGDYDVIVCYGYRGASFWIAGLGAKLSRKSLVLTTDAHSLEPQDHKKWKVGAKRAILPSLFRAADAVFAPSSRTVQYLIELGVNPGDVFLTPHAVEAARFAKFAGSSNREASRRRWGARDGSLVTLFCGKLVPWKRPHDLLEAAKDLSEVHVVFVGDGSLRRELESSADSLGLRHRVHFEGFVNQTKLPEMYAGADVLVLPSAHEAFGVVVNEAFACGRPAIVSNACGAAGNLVTEGETGFVFSVGDLNALQDCIRVLVENGGLAAEMGNKARALVEDEWSPQANAEAFAKACLTLELRRRRRRPTMAMVGRQKRT